MSVIHKSWYVEDWMSFFLETSGEFKGFLLWDGFDLYMNNVATAERVC